MIVNIDNTQHPEYWERPQDFFPERFAPEVIKTTMKHPFQYIPFSSGPRNCIGQRFATFEFTAILALILRKFSFYIEEKDFLDIRIEETVTCGPRNMNIVLTQR